MFVYTSTQIWPEHSKIGSIQRADGGIAIKVIAFAYSLILSLSIIHHSIPLQPHRSIQNSPRKPVRLFSIHKHTHTNYTHNTLGTTEPTLLYCMWCHKICPENGIFSCYMSLTLSAFNLSFNASEDFYFNDITIYIHNDRIHILVEPICGFRSIQWTSSTIQLYYICPSRIIGISKMPNDNNDTFNLTECYPPSVANAMSCVCLIILFRRLVSIKHKYRS